MMSTQQQKELSDSLLAACRESGFENPKYIAQDDDGSVWHYESQPDYDDTLKEKMWASNDASGTTINHPPYADDWQDSLLEWVHPDLLKCPNPLSQSSEPLPIQSVLRILASQEGCDGAPWDQMMQAADYIDELTKQGGGKK